MELRKIAPFIVENAERFLVNAREKEANVRGEMAIWDISSEFEFISEGETRSVEWSEATVHLLTWAVGGQMERERIIGGTRRKGNCRRKKMM